MVVALITTGCGTSGDASVPVSTAAALRIGQARVYRVPSGSMEPTLPIGARVVVKEGPPIVGAIVVFHPPEGAEQEECGPKPHVLRVDEAACDAPIPEEEKVTFIKRVVAGPGDEIYVRAGHVYRKANGSHRFVRESDSYICACGVTPDCNFPVPIKIPAGHWFMMGDNRGESADSRFWGPVPTAWIVGVATKVINPCSAGVRTLRCIALRGRGAQGAL
jgi:signal peptidase I